MNLSTSRFSVRSLITLAASSMAFAASASAASFSVNFENSWDYGASVGTFYQASQGVTFSDSCLGLSNNDGLGSNPDGSYYANAPSPMGVLNPYYFETGVARPIMNITAGVSGSIEFWYSSPQAVAGAVVAYSGLDGTGDVLGSFDLSSTFAFSSNPADFNYNVWVPTSFAFSGVARSFDFTNSANIAGYDNISSVPTPGAMMLVVASAPVLLRRRSRR